MLPLCYADIIRNSNNISFTNTHPLKYLTTTTTLGTIAANTTTHTNLDVDAALGLNAYTTTTYTQPDVDTAILLKAEKINYL